MLSRNFCNRESKLVVDIEQLQFFSKFNNMPTYPNDNTMSSTVLLRRITILSFLPAFLILLIHGVKSSWAFPALGILPLAVSAVLGALLLHRDRVAAVGSAIQALSPANIFYADTVLAVWYFAFLIPTWLFLGRPWDRGLIILGTYGSVFLMVNLFVCLIYRCLL